MIGSREWRAIAARRTGRGRPGTAGHLVLFGWSLAAVFLTPAARLWAAGLLCLLAAAAFYPESLKRLFQRRWLALIGLMALPALFLPGEPLVSLGSLSPSREGLQAAALMALRAGMVLLAVDGFTASVSIGEIAALFERAGLQGLGFATGVALNLLPILRHSITVTWHSLRMRGGLRRHPLRSLRFFLITVVAGAVQRAEEIALAAEARAYSPGKARPAPLRYGAHDRLLLVAGLLLLLALRLPV